MLIVGTKGRELGERRGSLLFLGSLLLLGLVVAEMSILAGQLDEARRALGVCMEVRP